MRWVIIFQLHLRIFLPDAASFPKSRVFTSGTEILPCLKPTKLIANTEVTLTWI